MTAIPVCCDKAVYKAYFECPMHHPSPLGCDHLDKPYRALLEERDRLRGQVERMKFCLIDLIDTCMLHSIEPIGSYTPINSGELEQAIERAEKALESHDQA